SCRGIRPQSREDERIGRIANERVLREPREGAAARSNAYDLGLLAGAELDPKGRGRREADGGLHVDLIVGAGSGDRVHESVAVATNKERFWPVPRGTLSETTIVQDAAGDIGTGIDQIGGRCGSLPECGGLVRDGSEMRGIANAHHRVEMLVAVSE